MTRIDVGQKKIISALFESFPVLQIARNIDDDVDQSKR